MKRNYVPQPVNTDIVELGQDLECLVEQMAKNTHEVWAKTRIEQGWTYGEQRDDTKKQHPCLIAYEELSNEEKEYDRNTAIETLKLVKTLGFDIVKIN